MMTVTIDDGIKASLATLELVKYTSGNGDKTLSNDEVEAAHLSLDQIIQTAESIKEKLPSSITSNEIDCIAAKARNARSSLPPPAPPELDNIATKHRNTRSSLPPTVKFKQKTNDEGTVEKQPESANDQSNTNVDGETPQRRLSTPCIIPMQTISEVRISFIGK